MIVLSFLTYVKMLKGNSTAQPDCNQHPTRSRLYVGTELGEQGSSSCTVGQMRESICTFHATNGAGFQNNASWFSFVLELSIKS